MSFCGIMVFRVFKANFVFYIIFYVVALILIFRLKVWDRKKHLPLLLIWLVFIVIALVSAFMDWLRLRNS